MTDFSNFALASRAVAFYDDLQQFEASLESVCEEAPWSSDERVPAPGGVSRTQGQHEKMVG
jgi:hypothetical protein